MGVIEHAARDSLSGWTIRATSGSSPLPDFARIPADFLAAVLTTVTSGGRSVQNRDDNRVRLCDGQPRRSRRRDAASVRPRRWHDQPPEYCLPAPGGCGGTAFTASS